MSSIPSGSQHQHVGTTELDDAAISTSSFIGNGPRTHPAAPEPGLTTSRHVTHVPHRRVPCYPAGGQRGHSVREQPPWAHDTSKQHLRGDALPTSGRTVWGACTTISDILVEMRSYRVC